MLIIQQPRPTVFCEICGIEVLLDYAFAFFVSTNRTGHALIGAYGCDQSPDGQHYGCTMEHAEEAAIACLKYHHHSRLIMMHSSLLAQGKTKASEPDKELEKTHGDTFHFTGKVYGQ